MTKSAPVGHFIRFAAAIFMLTFMATNPATNPAMAQDADLKGLSEELQRLGKDIKDIQLYIFRGDEAAASILESGAAQMQSGNDAIAARMEVRFGEVEDQFRSLTGQIEELSHRISVVSDRVEKLINDVDFRLSEIEQAQAKTDALARAAPQFQQPVAPQSTNQKAALGHVLSNQPAAATEPGTLGSVSLNALSTDDTAYTQSPQPVPALPAGTIKQQYDYAFSLLRQQEYAEAERALTAFLDAHPGDKLAGNANYWLAETYYVRGDFRRAAGYFATGYKNFPDGNKASDNLLKLAMSLANLKEIDKACFTFKELSERYPDAPPSIKQRADFESQRAGCS